METQTRPLTLDEMYFKKVGTKHLPPVMNQNSLNNSFQESGGILNPIDSIQKAPTINLTGEVFSEPAFLDKAGAFLKKNWIWLLLGTCVVTVICIAVNENDKKKKRQNQLPSYPHS
jgi:hypothetical protein